MKTILESRALTDARQPLPSEFVDLLAAIDENRITFHRKAFRADLASLTEDTAHFVFDFTTNRRRELLIQWSDSVENELLRRGIAMDAAEDEAARGGRLLLSTLAYLDLSFGTRLVDAAIKNTVGDRFAHVEPIRTLIEQIPDFQVDQATPSFIDCAFVVRSTIDGYGNSLVLHLGYPNQEAFAILVGAVYFMFDRRHQLSTKQVVLGDER